jgi:hypothetical protein
MSEGKDPLDELSSCYIEKDGKLHEMTPRELAKYCADEMVLWDSLWPELRLKNQVRNDPDYKPIAPMAGHKKHRRWRG